MESTTWSIDIEGVETSALYQPASAGDRDILFVCAHGAGGHMGDRGMAALADTLAERGLSMLRFNFLYREKGSSRPDAMPRLETTVAAVVEHARRELNPRTLIIGGRSMGGRAASMLLAKGFPVDGLLLLAYPLHPAGQPEKLRTAHLAEIRSPVLCINGTRDPLCTPELMTDALSRVGTNWRMHWLEGADHSFHVPKSSGRDDAAVMTEVGDVVGSWLSDTALG